MSTTEVEVADPPAELKPVSVLCVATPDIRPIKDLNEWFSFFETAETLEEHIWLLHIGFDMEVADLDYRRKQTEVQLTSFDRIICYLNFADGHEGDVDDIQLREERGYNHYYGRDQNQNRNKLDPGGLRRLLAQKAFTQLCNHFFKKYLPEGDRDPEEGWAVRIVENLLPELQYFFRMEYNYRNTLRNLRGTWYTPKHEVEIVVKFLVNLARFLWEWEGQRLWHGKEEEVRQRDEANAKFQATLDAAKPWMIEVLYEIGKIDLLRRYLLRLEPASLDKLREIAYRKKFDKHKHPVAENRSVKTIDEAIYVGSVPARLLKEYESIKGVDEKLRAIQERKQQQAELAREIEELDQEM